jgi:hypothetical protein
VAASSLSWGAQHLHGVVIVRHNSRRFSRGGALKTRIVHVAENPLEPGQQSRRGHRLVRKMAFQNEDKKVLVIETKETQVPQGKGT